MPSVMYVKRKCKTGAVQVSKDKDLKEVNGLPYFNPSSDEMKNFILANIQWGNKVEIAGQKNSDGNYTILSIKKIDEGYAKPKSNFTGNKTKWQPKSPQQVTQELDNKTLNTAIMTAGSIVTALIAKGTVDLNLAGETLVTLTNKIYNETYDTETSQDKEETSEEVEEPEVEENLEF